MTKRILLCALLGIGLIYGQSGALSWSIYQVPLMNSTRPGPFATDNFRNVGQTTHQIIVTFLPNPTQLCIGSLSNDTTLQASYDGVVYFSFGVRVNVTNPAIPQNNVFEFVGTGAYPRVRFAVGTYNNVTCNITIDYSGSTTNPFTQILGSVSQGQGVAPGTPPVVTGGLGDGSIVRTLPVCDLTTAGTVAAGTTARVIFPIQITPAPAQTARICSIVLDSTNGATADVNVISGTTTTTPCDTTPTTILPVNLVANAVPFGYGSGSGSVLNGQLGQEICIQAIGNAITYSVTYARI